MNPWFIQEFTKLVGEKVESRSKSILNGIDNPLENSQTIGYRKGLLAALEVFKELCEKMENE